MDGGIGETINGGIDGTTGLMEGSKGGSMVGSVR